MRGTMGKGWNLKSEGIRGMLKNLEDVVLARGERE